MEANGRNPVHVTATQLADAINGDPHQRLVANSTVAWELWRRRAFDKQRNGSYLFCPEYGAQIPYTLSNGSLASSRVSRVVPDKNRSLIDMVLPTSHDQAVAIRTKVDHSRTLISSELETQLRRELDSYFMDKMRECVLEIRAIAGPKIRYYLNPIGSMRLHSSSSIAAYGKLAK